VAGLSDAGVGVGIVDDSIAEVEATGGAGDWGAGGEDGLECREEMRAGEENVRLGGEGGATRDFKDQAVGRRNTSPSGRIEGGLGVPGAVFAAERGVGASSVEGVLGAVRADARASNWRER
jgi:hypothetical protein